MENQSQPNRTQPEPQKVQPRTQSDNSANNKPLETPTAQVAAFKALGVSDAVLKAIQHEGFEEPTKIQKEAIPHVVSGKDVIAGAATGSGKTLAFGAGVIQSSTEGFGVQALILTPTRELAEQVSKALRSFSRFNPLSIISIYGGVGIEPQIMKLRKADVVVATPGRLLDHMDRRTVDLSRVKILVLDEADRMLDMGFIADVEKIVRACPQKRQTLLFSATIKGAIRSLSRNYMKDPVEVFAETYVDPSKLAQVYYDVQDNLKFSVLVHLLTNESSRSVMVFCNTQRMTNTVANNLKKNGIDAIAIHGGFSQSQRNRAMSDFQTEKNSVLVCTDVAARGLDIKSVSHVYNYDIPKESNQYVHRIGRTARAGKEGKVVNIIASRDYENFDRVKRDTGSVIMREELPDVERITLKHGESERGRGGPRRPPSRGRGGPRRPPSRGGSRSGGPHGRGRGGRPRHQQSSGAKKGRDGEERGQGRYPPGRRR